MKCVYCGFENESDFIFCPSCGKEAPTEPTTEPGLNPAANHVLAALKDKLFFVLCILLTVSSGCSVLSGEFNVLTILATIFAWIVYNSATKDIADTKNLRSISGTVYAQYVIVNVVSIILAVCGGLFSVLFSAMFSSSLFMEEFMSELEGELYEYFSSIDITELFGAASSAIILIFFIAVAVGMFLFNFFGTRNIHKFIKSAYQSIENGAFSYEKCRTARIWLMVLGIMSAVSALTSLNAITSLSFFSSAALAAVQIIASVLIKKYFSQFE